MIDDPDEILMITKEEYNRLSNGSVTISREEYDELLRCKDSYELLKLKETRAKPKKDVLTEDDDILSYGDLE